MFWILALDLIPTQVKTFSEFICIESRKFLKILILLSHRRMSLFWSIPLQSCLIDIIYAINPVRTTFFRSLSQYREFLIFMYIIVPNT
jgi:hypothetical protein